MADADSTSKEINNGFDKVDRLYLECHCHITMDCAKKIANLFATIKRLYPNDPEIGGLTDHGKYIADDISNDTDVIRECAMKAGLIAFHVEASHV